MKYKIGDILVIQNKPLFDADKLYVVIYGTAQLSDGIKQYRLFPLGNQQMPFPLNPDGTYVHSIEYVEKWYRKVET
jgi:hypothetical protein